MPKICWPVNPISISRCQVETQEISAPLLAERPYVPQIDTTLPFHGHPTILQTLLRSAYMRIISLHLDSLCLWLRLYYMHSNWRRPLPLPSPPIRLRKSRWECSLRCPHPRPLLFCPSLPSRQPTKIRTAMCAPTAHLLPLLLSGQALLRLSDPGRELP